MHISFYKSSLCPRCYLAKKHLLRLLKTVPGITLTEIDILTSPKRSWQDGIRMVPGLKINGEILSASFLSENAIKAFLLKNCSQAVKTSTGQK